MIALMWNLSAAIRRHLCAYMPSNIAIALLRSRRGPKWALPVAVLVVPAYGFIAAMVSAGIDRGAPAWLNVLVLLFSWNAMKFASIAVLSPILQLAAPRHHRSPAPPEGFDGALMSQSARRAVAVLDEPDLSRYT